MSAFEFDFASHQLLLMVIGAALLLSYWLPQLVFRRPPSASAALMIFGMGVAVLFPGLFSPLAPQSAPAFWEVSAEIVVIVVLFSTGLRIDDLGGLRLWHPTIGLLAVTMPLTIGAVTLLGWGLVGMTVPGAILLGAVLAPTDPVLAGDVQVGPPLEGREHPVRFSLTTEAGLNDGLAFPFVYLALHAAAGSLGVAGWAEWVVWDVLYRIGVGAALGAGIGWLLGQALFVYPAGNTLARSGPGVLALAGVLFCYGLVELAEGYGFVAVFIAGMTMRRVEAGHSYHQRLHAFSDALETAMTAILLVLLGGMLPALWPYLDGRHAVIGFGLILVVRPMAGLLGLLGTALNLRERAVVACYGVRGIGSIYYLGYAATHVTFIDRNELWALVSFTIFASTFIHGLTAAESVRLLVREPRE
ncbi:hypothetical protein Rumeso_04905 [Rubellimicrobium mesophilum DSM 19309]|uniref:Cation/H+ exchanger transmembrane domain-containing protein n=1 Tax=Rubellimicrobium mesophilum DSM 19309 TaxID=442562 RepID=A0A017HCJ9_9RHOB|nr:cation:proton antiporter [Rubellimicrobium mesophilum]EYD71504.1 hypothetical protein Rumeso_04905 [Rubellimicrobium mesophilum DSM 19309]